MVVKVEKGVTLYTTSAPNGWKITVALKELGYPHKLQAVALSKQEQKEDWFLKINPNGRIPAIVDHDNDDFAVFESGSILMYLAEKAGKLYPQEFSKRSEVNQWLFFQCASMGPMQGQAFHFVKLATEKIGYGQKRYVAETRRVFGVLDARLEGRDWLAADEYTIADICTFCWAFLAPGVGIDLAREFPNVKRWIDAIAARPAVKEGLDLPEPSAMKDKMLDPEGVQEMIKGAQAAMVE